MKKRIQTTSLRKCALQVRLFKQGGNLSNRNQLSALFGSLLCADIKMNTLDSLQEALNQIPARKMKPVRLTRTPSRYISDSGKHSKGSPSKSQRLVSKAGKSTSNEKASTSQTLAKNIKHVSSSSSSDVNKPSCDSFFKHKTPRSSVQGTPNETMPKVPHVVSKRMLEAAHVVLKRIPSIPIGMSGVGSTVPVSSTSRNIPPRTSIAPEARCLVPVVLLRRTLSSEPDMVPVRALTVPFMGPGGAPPVPVTVPGTHFTMYKTVRPMRKTSAVVPVKISAMVQ